MHDVSALWPRLMEHVAVEEEERVQSDILGGNFPPERARRKMRQKCSHFLGPHVLWVPFLVEEDKAFDPSKVGFFCADTQMPQTDSVSCLIKELRFWLHTPSRISMPLDRCARSRLDSNPTARAQRYPRCCML